MNGILNRQLALPLSFRIVNDHNNFILNNTNKIALSLIDEFANIKNFSRKYNFPVLILHGPSRSGKTHLAHIYKQITKAEFINKLSSFDLKKAKLGQSFIIDNLDKLEDLNEEFLFYFFNEILLNSGSLLITTTKPINNIRFNLQDLRSRINSCISTKIDLPDDEILYAILIKELDDKKLFLNDKACIYIIKRIKRSYKSVLNFVKYLDRISLEEKKGINLKQIKDVLNIVNLEV